ncbi:DoxX family protein [Streptomyces sp. NPDC048392]|uniref:DoxX family protein n=1 Tax=Streptomyces sp. NPDC048392 TaxID=3365543 RepID=UPI0037248281
MGDLLDGLRGEVGAVGVDVVPLAPAAAVGFAVMQTSATGIHPRLGDRRVVALNLTLLAIAAATVPLAFATTWL